MTLGGLVMYIFFTGLLAAPVVQMASIGTQISEAFAGLDRIRELRSMVTEQDEDEGREPLESVHGDLVFQDVSFEYDPGVPVLKHVSLKLRPAPPPRWWGPAARERARWLAW